VNSRTVGGRSSETQSHPIDMNNMNKTTLRVTHDLKIYTFTLGSKNLYRDESFVHCDRNTLSTITNMRNIVNTVYTHKHIQKLLLYITA
jgi:hypothetical protein